MGRGLVVLGAPLDLEELLEGVLRLPRQRRRGGGGALGRGGGGEEPPRERPGQGKHRATCGRTDQGRGREMPAGAAAAAAGTYSREGGRRAKGEGLWA